MTLIPHLLLRLNRINKLNVVYEFDYEVGYTIECNWDVGYNSTKTMPVLQIWEFIE